METNNMWMIWKRDAAGLNYGQTVDVVDVFLSAHPTCDIIAHGDSEQTVHRVPISWLYRSAEGYAHGTSYDDTIQ